VCVLILDLCKQNILGISHNFIPHTFLLHTVSRLHCNTYHLHPIPIQMRKWGLVWWAWVNSSQAVTQCYFCTSVGNFFPKPSWRIWQRLNITVHLILHILWGHLDCLWSQIYKFLQLFSDLQQLRSPTPQITFKIFMSHSESPKPFEEKCTW
jgi:hypothetical protein